jgi:hypothetical protein
MEKIVKKMEKNEFSFEKGYGQVRQRDTEKIKSELIAALNVQPAAWYNRLRGITEPKISEYRKIEEIFSKYGITDIWGA